VNADYAAKRRSAADAVALIPEGAYVLQNNAVGEPPGLLAAVAERVRAGDLRRVRMASLLPMAASAASIFAADVQDRIEWESLFASGADRDAVRRGAARFIPAQFHQIPRLIMENLDVDVALIRVSRVDEHGWMSLGVNVDTVKAAIAKARLVLAEVCPRMPRVHGNSWVHASEVDALVEHDAPIQELPVPPARDEDAAMGERIAEMIPNGATIQLGIGGVPNAVARSLRSHRDLGIHTEMFVDAMFDLIEAGVVTGTRKTFHPGKAIYTFAAGSQRMYEFLDDNPYIEAHPVDYTNHPAQIARNADMISVNSTIEVDLTGQCCSESVGPAQWSGTGGQLDYVRGAYDAPGGKSIIAFYSTAKGGAVSRVVPTLTPGAAVTTPRTDVHWLVTEHGAVNLKGKSTRDRARALIGLAAPQFRDDLERAGRDLGYWRD
jgi:itaconate CoA-transferase